MSVDAVRQSYPEDVRAVEIVQAKNRWLGEELGYVPGGLRTKRRLIGAVQMYRAGGKGILFVTLTYDPDQWVDAESCYRASRSGRHVGEFFRRLERSFPGMHAFAVMEFHTGGGEHHGWIHWHVLLVGPMFIDSKEVERLWGWGFVKVKGANDGADRYLCKYLTKGLSDVPAYMSVTDSRVHLVHTTHGFWEVLGEHRNERAGAAEPPRLRRASPTVGEIRRAPKQYLRTMMRAILWTGEEVYRSIATDLVSLVELLGRIGSMGGVSADKDGHASMPLPAGRIVRLDYLLNCGTDRPPPSDLTRRSGGDTLSQTLSWRCCNGS